MSAESDLYAILSGDAAITALVGTRIYPDAMPEETTYPAIVFSRTSTEPVGTISGQRFGEFASMQVGCWAKTRGASDAVATAVTDALIVAGEMDTARQGGFDPETGLFATTVDVTLLAV